jgi:Family of unknown function (DUF6074)
VSPDRISRDQIADWLTRLQADHELPASAFRLAFGVSQVADAGGFIIHKTLADNDLGNLDGLDDLVARGYLQPVRDGYRLKQGGRGAKEPVTSAAMFAFPLARRRAFVTKHATRLAQLSRAHGNAHLRAQLKLQAETLRRKGVAEAAIAREIRSLESAIRAELWRAVFAVSAPEDVG